VQCGPGPLGTLGWGEEGGGGGASATGSATLSLGPAGMPAHTHTASFTPGAVEPPVPPQVAFHASTDPATTGVAPVGGFLSAQPTSTGTASSIYNPTASGSVTLSGVTATASGGGGITGGTVGVASAGSGQAVAAVTAEVPGSLPPFVAIRFGICWKGIFPQRP
jgi:microcystin-dependent protein